MTDGPAGRYPALHAPSQGYVFIVTYGRSGSTLTQSLLNAIPGYCIRGENGNLTALLARAADRVQHHPMFAQRRADAALPPEKRRPYLRPLLGQPFDPWAGAEAVDPQAFRLALMDAFVAQVLRPDPGCRVCGFKEIRFHEDPEFFPAHMAVLRDSFPQARFLFQTRGHDAVARSGWWADQPRDQVLADLARADALFRGFAAAHPDRSRIIAYEGLAHGPDYLRHIFDFLGEPFDPDAVAALLARQLGH